MHPFFVPTQKEPWENNQSIIIDKWIWHYKHRIQYIQHITLKEWITKLTESLRLLIFQKLPWLWNSPGNLVHHQSLLADTVRETNVTCYLHCWLPHGNPVSWGDFVTVPFSSSHYHPPISILPLPLHVYFDCWIIRIRKYLRSILDIVVTLVFEFWFPILIFLDHVSFQLWFSFHFRLQFILSSSLLHLHIMIQESWLMIIEQNLGQYHNNYISIFKFCSRKTVQRNGYNTTS